MSLQASKEAMEKSARDITGGVGLWSDEQRAKLHQAMADEHMKINAGQTTNPISGKRYSIKHLIQELYQASGCNEAKARSIKSKLFGLAESSERNTSDVECIESALHLIVSIINDSNIILERVDELLGE